jgi:hypothetical protein
VPPRPGSAQRIRDPARPLIISTAAQTSSLRMAASRVNPSLSAVVTSSPEQLAGPVERAPGAWLLAQWIPTHSILASFASRSRFRADCRCGRPGGGAAAAAAHPSADDKTQLNRDT